MKVRKRILLKAIHLLPMLRGLLILDAVGLLPALLYLHTRHNQRRVVFFGTPARAEKSEILSCADDDTVTAKNNNTVKILS